MYFTIKIHPEISEILQFNLQSQFKSNRITELNVAFSSITFETIKDTLKKFIPLKRVFYNASLVFIYSNLIQTHSLVHKMNTSDLETVQTLNTSVLPHVSWGKYDIVIHILQSLNMV